jgi:hypothetical protein
LEALAVALGAAEDGATPCSLVGFSVSALRVDLPSGATAVRSVPVEAGRLSLSNLYSRERRARLPCRLSVADSDAPLSAAADRVGDDISVSAGAEPCAEGDFGATPDSGAGAAAVAAGGMAAVASDAGCASGVVADFGSGCPCRGIVAAAAAGAAGSL